MVSNLLRKINIRHWSNDELKYCISYLDNYESVINISGWKDEDKEGDFYKNYFLNAKIYHISNFPNDHAKGIMDINDIKIDLSKKIDISLHNKYNIVFNHTVLEHVEDPVFAFSEMSNLTNDLMITVIPWVQQLHFIENQFGDFYRFSPMLMRKLYLDNGFTILYENFMPNFANECYLIYVGTKKINNHKSFPQNLKPISYLNGKVGHMGFFNTVLNIFLRLIYKIKIWK
jgi:hypothetical protein